MKVDVKGIAVLQHSGGPETAKGVAAAISTVSVCTAKQHRSITAHTAEQLASIQSFNFYWTRHCAPDTHQIFLQAPQTGS